MESLRQGWRAVIMPIAKFCVRCHISANQVTIAGSLLTVIAALATGVSGFLFPGALAITILVLFDSLDGTVASLTNSQSSYGAFLDSTLDRIGDWAVFSGLVLYAALRGSSMGMPLTMSIVCLALLAIMSAFVTSYARARAQSLGGQAHVGPAARADRLTITLLGMAIADWTNCDWVIVAALALLNVLSITTVIMRIRQAGKELQ